MNMMMPGMMGMGMGMGMPYGMGGMGMMPGTFGVGMPTDSKAGDYYEHTGRLAPSNLMSMSTEMGASAYARDVENQYSLKGAVAGGLGLPILAGILIPAVGFGIKPALKAIGKLNPVVAGVAALGLTVGGIALGGLQGGRLGNYIGRNDFIHMDIADDGWANNSTLYDNALGSYYAKVQGQQPQGVS
jgi:hypothetical protein